ncbi:hypothetical protein J5N97_015425 [Dioscorea zingiberensis]|uniref:EF-hand domain-containing protein n=1 Tax=Dioscorea zingiberensis TaxID=325984 RepID=A0A9D5HKN0_9LILI|nr:hypothetical protein J5N97_015425 [Dioscorea zingiberensis]
MCPSDRSVRREASEFRSAFDVLDADHDGRISRDDLKAFYSAFPSATTDDEIHTMISAADADLNGFVEFHEFQRVLNAANPRGVESIFEEAFKVMDRDGDGRVGFDDLKVYFGTVGMEVGDEDVRAMIRMGGGDERDGVGFDALLKILAVDFAKGDL